LGVVTRLTLQTHSLPEFFGRVSATIQARSEVAFRQLIAKVVSFYSQALLNPHWGEQIALRPENFLEIKMVFQGLDRREAEAIWNPFFDWLGRDPANFRIVSPPVVTTVPARHYWDPQQRPGAFLADDRAAVPASNVYWAANLEEAGMVLHGYQSAWIPVSLLQADQQKKLTESLFQAARHWEVVLHVNKGLAGANSKAIEAARDTAMNPAVLDAFALLICAAAEPPAYPGIPGREPDLLTARHRAELIEKAMNEIKKALPSAGSYVAESDFFEESWQASFWGSNYPRLLAVKDRYDPEGLFFVHQGVGSERYSRLINSVPPNAMNDRLRLISGNQSLVLDSTDGRETLAHATDLFRYIDSNFEHWNCNLAASPTTAVPVQVYEMLRDSTLQQMFDSFGLALDRLTFTQAQIKQFAKRYTDWLKKGGNGTFFLFQVGQEFLVAAVYFFLDGRLGVRVRRLTLERVFRARKGHRLVLPIDSAPVDGGR
jgi:Berberine and berberine like